MKKVLKVVLAAAAVAAMAVPAVAANKLVVKDNAATPNNVFVVTDDGKMGLGGDPTNIFDVFAVFPGQATTNLVTTISTFNDQGRYTFRRANGTPSTTLTALQVNQNIANLNFRGYNGTGWNAASSAGIVVVAEETFTPSTGAARMAFFTQQSGVVPTGGTERLRIAGDGRLRISNQPAAPANNVACTVGDLILDATNGYLYLCSSTTSPYWKRATFAAY